MDSTLNPHPYNIGGYNLEEANALEWAKAFVHLFPEHADLEDLLHVWFANAMSIAEDRGRDRGIIAGRNGEKTRKEYVDMVLAPIDHDQ